jgi:hypothetical protein
MHRRLYSAAILSCAGSLIYFRFWLWLSQPDPMSLKDFKKSADLGQVFSFRQTFSMVFFAQSEGLAFLSLHIWLHSWLTAL